MPSSSNFRLKRPGLLTLKEFGPSGRMPLSAVAAFVGQKEVALDAIFLEADLSVIASLG
jgi:hypothetical protein